jgi:indolepyruvate ferredoxin oxidoreductase alpha subunit
VADSKKALMQGNDAMARGLIESGCVVAASYPGTPASELLAAVDAWRESEGVTMHVEWAVNEKVAFEIAYAASQSGLRAVTAMKQVGLNVASDPLMSAAYLGVIGGFVIISADDPGPHSSQTEQDSRMMAMLAKIPVLDPSTPDEAKALAGLAFELSEEFQVPVMLRPTTRVCHACQDVELLPVARLGRRADFIKDPRRWAATPGFRYELHVQLIDKLVRIAAHPATAPQRLNPGTAHRSAVVASGVAAAHAREALFGLGLWDSLAFYQVIQPYPLHSAFIDEITAGYSKVLILEETSGVIELQLRNRELVRGKLSGFVPEAGELLPETIERLLADFAEQHHPQAPAAEPGERRRPTLCPGCPHRASFYAIKKAAPKGIYPSDIGCYTLGINLGAVDTVLCMGAAIGQACGFYHAHRITGVEREIIATIGDSTFFHAGIPPLIDAVVQGARFVLVILDNTTTGMTGNQPTPAHGTPAGRPVRIDALVQGCGVGFCKTADPLEMPSFLALLKEALAWSRSNGVAVVIAKSPCLVDRSVRHARRTQVMVETETCTGCQICTRQFECPALLYDAATGKVHVDVMICSGCSVCLDVCPVRAIKSQGGGS